MKFYAGQGRLKGMSSGMIKKSFRLEGHATSVALEAEFWAVLEGLARDEGLGLAALVARIDGGRSGSGRVDRGLASSLRLHVLHSLRR